MENDLEVVECPYCMEKILAKAKKCKHCGEILDAQMREIELLKKQINTSPLVINNNNTNTYPSVIYDKKNYPWFWHLILTLITGGGWLIIWIILYLLRDRKIYN